jgi:hypothetical protein
MHTYVASTPNFDLSIECVVLIGCAGLILLRFFIIDAQAHAKLGPNAPSLVQAFKCYLAHLLERYPYPVAQSNTP